MTRYGHALPENATDDELRELYGPDAEEIIAFKRFLALPHEEGEPGMAGQRGRKLCPPHWYEYGTGKISGAEVVRIDDELKAKETNAGNEY